MLQGMLFSWNRYSMHYRPRKKHFFHEQVKRDRLTFFSYHLFKTCNSCPVTKENLTFMLMILYSHNRLSMFMIIAQMNFLFCMNACQ